MNFKNWITNLPQQYSTHKNADLPLKKYLAVYSQKFKNVTIGCSFDPDLVRQMYRLENNEESLSQQKILKVLKVLIHDLDIQQIRLGVKWNKVVNEKREFDFSYYEPFLDYCLSNDVQVCLNIGPIKTFGWPEVYIPEYLVNTQGNNRSHITKNSVIGEQALSYLNTLLSHIQSQYTKKQCANISIIQIENELFNPFGKQKFTFDEEYLEQVVKKVRHYFPDEKILFSSSESKDVQSIVNLMKLLTKKEQITYDQCIVGINYYYNLPQYIKLPKIGPLDHITISNFLQKNTHENNKKLSHKLGYSIEVTEAQFEQWGKLYLSPGFSHHEAKYLLARCVDNILNTTKPSTIRLWGFERYAKKTLENTLNMEQKENIQLIKSINSLA